MPTESVYRAVHDLRRWPVVYFADEPRCVCAHRPKFDGGQPGADCLTPKLRINGHLTRDHKRNLFKSVAVSQGMPYAGGDLLRRRQRLRHLWQCAGAGHLPWHAWRISNDWRIIAL
jgi:hypothetical protein